MTYLDNAIVELFYFAFLIVVIVFLTTLAMKIIASFFKKIFRFGKEKENE